MRRFRSLPIRQQIVWTVLGVSLVTLSVTAAGLTVYDLLSFEERILEDVSMRVGVLVPSLASAMAAGDRQVGSEVLFILHSDPQIRAVCILNRDGSKFASYVNPELEGFHFPSTLPPVGAWFEAGQLTWVREITALVPTASAALETREQTAGDSAPATREPVLLGHLYVYRALPSFGHRFLGHGIVLGSMALGLLAASLLLSATLTPLTQPILQLSAAAEQVQDGNYSVRVPVSSDDELGQLSTAFNRMLATLEQRESALRDASTEHRALQEQLIQAQKMESIGRLAGGVAHDFNNLLTVIVGSAELSLQQLPANHVTRPLLQNAQRAASQAGDLTRQLLAFARRQVVEPVVLDPRRLLLEVEDMLHRLIGEDIELGVIPENDVWPIKADPAQMTQVLMNLAANARDAMPGGGTLSIECHNALVTPAAARGWPDMTAGEYVLLRVTDTGDGIPDDVRRHLFEPFYTTKPSGTGLGLATCYGIVKQSGGHIFVESSPGQGATFEVYLPRADEEEVEPIGASGVITTTPGRERVLVVEDNPLVRATTVALLRAQGYTVNEAASGPDALRLLSEGDYEIDLLLADVVMPQMSGVELAQELRSRDQDLRVLYVSGYAADAVGQLESLPAGVGFLQKPFTSARLLRSVREVLDTGEPTDSIRRRLRPPSFGGFG